MGTRYTAHSLGGYIRASLERRKVKVIFLPKTGRIEYCIPIGYRPITNSSLFFKIVEMPIERYIRDAVLRNQPLHACQYSYTIERSTRTKLYLVIGRIQKSLDQKESDLAVFIDTEEAFDKTTFPKRVLLLQGRFLLQ